MLGAYLKHCGLKARHSLKIGPKKLTPDWSVVGDKMTVKAIVELYSFHIDAINQNKIDQQLQTRLVATYHPDENISRDDRLYARLCEKADKYQSLAKEFELPYVIAVFCTFEVAMDLNETKVCIFNEQRPFFEKYPEVSGMLHIEESGGTYIFNSIGNLKAQRPLELPNGRLYLSDAKSDLQMDFSSAGPIS